MVTTRADDIGNWTFGFLNKRWLIAGYNVTVLTFVVLPLAVARLVSFRSQTSESTVAARPRAKILRTIAECAALILVVWYFAGPPWHLERHHRPIDWHEHAHLGSLQAISKGYFPYIGPASTQYGPGSQLLMYGIMRASGTFDIVSFRMAWATFNFVALLLVALVSYLWLGVWLTSAVVLLEVAYSPFASFFTMADGTLGGFYGWSNALRYLAPLVVVPALTRLTTRHDHRVPMWRCVLLGAVWGIGSWLAQESLSATMWAGGLLLIVLILTDTIRPSQGLQIAGWLVVGMLAVTLPIVIVYASHHDAGGLIRNYFLQPRAVAAGYSNLWWPDVDRGRPDLYSYYWTFPFLLIVILATLWRWPSVQPWMPLEDHRARLVAFTLVLLASYQTALLRSDYSHLMNTMIALPFVLVVGWVDLPGCIGQGRRTQMLARIAFIVLACSVYPVLPLHDWGALVRGPSARFRSPASAATDGRVSSGVATQRATGPLSHEPVFAGGSGLSTEQFLEFAEEVHRIVGSRRTYVGDLGWRAWPGAVYFFADLTPAPYPLDRVTLMLNDELRAMVADHIRTHPAEYECFIGLSLTDIEARAFLDTHEQARIVTRVLPAGEGWTPTTVYIVLDTSHEAGRESAFPSRPPAVLLNDGRSSDLPAI